jgi:hypothetical protein
VRAPQQQFRERAYAVTTTRHSGTVLRPTSAFVSFRFPRLIQSTVPVDCTKAWPQRAPTRCSQCHLKSTKRSNRAAGTVDLALTPQRIDIKAANRPSNAFTSAFKELGRYPQFKATRLLLLLILAAQVFGQTTQHDIEFVDLEGKALSLGKAWLHPCRAASVFTWQGDCNSNPAECDGFFGPNEPFRMNRLKGSFVPDSCRFVFIRSQDPESQDFLTLMSLKRIGASSGSPNPGPKVELYMSSLSTLSSRTSGARSRSPRIARQIDLSEARFPTSSPIPPPQKPKMRNEPNSHFRTLESPPHASDVLCTHRPRRRRGTKPI